jgi:transcriptional regulator with XRE-family HTH domain
MSGSDLGAFLRARREAVTPDQVGLPTGPRRRTPGLRRAELATISGISAEYLTRLEQGRDRHPSPQVLAALADALRLPLDDRVQLRNLAKAASGADVLCPGGAPEERVRPTIRALLDRLHPAPAVVLNRLGDTLACTPGYERLAGPIGLLDGEPPNQARFVFTDERARTAYPDWDRVADERVAALRAESSPDDPHMNHLIEELTVMAGAPFTERLHAAPVTPRRTGLERLVHPEAGELRLAYETLDAQTQTVVVYLPADDATSAALDNLTRAPGAVHTIRG